MSRKFFKRARNARVVPTSQVARRPVDCPYVAAQRLGWLDVLDGAPFRPSYETMPRKEQYAYERGRQRAVIARQMGGGRLVDWPATEYLYRVCDGFLGLQGRERLFEQTATGRRAPRAQAA